MFNSVQPSTYAFVTSDIVLTTTTTSTNAIYAGDQNGVHVPVGSPRTIWMCLYTAKETDTNLPQQMNLVITASAP
jgi:hypothetical protein